MVLCLFAGFVASSNGASELVLPDAKITVKVVDEAGIPVADADVGVGFNQGGNTWIGERKSESIRGVSDTNGLFSAQAKCMGGIGISVQKEGFYRSSVRQDYPGTYQNKRRWEPWNPTISVTLKEIKNPVPMFVKKVQSEIPDENRSIGFDLEKGEWVAPYGKGVNSDFVFSLHRQIESQNDFENILTLQFPNEGDGIGEIIAEPVSWLSLRLSHNAPLIGYQPQWQKKVQYKLPEGFSFTPKQSDNQNYYFRIRTILDDDGNIVSALYGKIHGQIDTAGYIAKKCTLTFTYYLNPTPNDRNLEFDPDKNLFEGRDRFAP